MAYADDKTVLVFAEMTDFLNLLCVHLHLPNESIKLNSIQHALVLKCRELIFTEHEIIASPHWENEPFIQIIMQQSLYKTGRLQTRFKKQGLEAGNPQQVQPDVYKACVTYTMLARLAPSWNKVGKWLIQGRDFLTNHGCLNAINLEVNVTNQQMYFAIKASMLRLPLAQVSDFGVCGSTYCDYLLQQNGRITESNLPHAWCHVLPSMKKGKIIEISKTLPKDSLFDSYRDLKRFWKNNYGYRLPELDTHIIYYQIHFLPIPGVTFTYPDVCVRSRDFIALPRIDGRSILQTFLQNLIGRVQQVCGDPLKVQSTVQYPLVALNPCMETNSPVNLTNRTESKNRRVPLRNPCEVQKMYSEHQRGQVNGIIETVNDVPQSQTISCHVKAQVKVMHREISSPSRYVVSQKEERIVPVFRPKLATIPVQNVENRTTRIVPNFTRKSGVIKSRPNLCDADVSRNGEINQSESQHFHTKEQGKVPFQATKTVKSRSQKMVKNEKRSCDVGSEVPQPEEFSNAKVNAIKAGRKRKVTNQTVPLQKFTDEETVDVKQRPGVQRWTNKKAVDVNRTAGVPEWTNNITGVMINCHKKTMLNTELENDIALWTDPIANRYLDSTHKFLSDQRRKLDDIQPREKKPRSYCKKKTAFHSQRTDENKGSGRKTEKNFYNEP